MSGKHAATVLYAGESLKQALGEIADDREGDAGETQRQKKCERNFEPETTAYGHHRAQQHAAEHALPGFPRRYRRRQTQASVTAAEKKRAHVRHPNEDEHK